MRNTLFRNPDHSMKWPKSSNASKKKIIISTGSLPNLTKSNKSWFYWLRNCEGANWMCWCHFVAIITTINNTPFLAIQWTFNKPWTKKSTGRQMSWRMSQSHFTIFELTAKPLIEFGFRGKVTWCVCQIESISHSRNRWLIISGARNSYNLLIRNTTTSCVVRPAMLPSCGETHDRLSQLRSDRCQQHSAIASESPDRPDVLLVGLEPVQCCHLTTDPLLCSDGRFHKDVRLVTWKCL
jgi:hypothetical protein